MLPLLEPHVGPALPLPRPGDQLGEAAVAVGADDEVHLGHLLEQGRTQALGHAPHHAQHAPRPLEPLQDAQAPEHALLGVVPHGAGVHEHHVRVRRVVGAHVPLWAEQSQHELGVGHVHLAAVGLDVDARHG